MTTTDAAIHEAAHVIAALVVKAPVEGVTLTPKSSEWSGHLILDREWSERVVQKEDLTGYEANCVVRIAAFALDRKLGKEETHALDDVLWAKERIEKYFPERGAAIIERATQIVEEHYDAIVKLGALLHQRRELSAVEIAEFWKGRGKK